MNEYNFNFIILLILFFLLKTNDLIILFLLIEIQSISLYILFKKKKKIKEIESSIIYFFFNCIFSFFFLLFIVYINNYILYYLNFILLYKIGIFPFFFWVNLVYDGLSFSNIAILSIFPKITFFILIYKINYINLIYLCIFTIYLGNIIAINQTKLKKLLAYSSIINMSIIYIILISGNFIFYLLFYNFIILIFLLILKLEFIIEYSKGYLNLFQWIILLLILNISGIPPLGGFFLKLILFNYIIIQSYLFIIIFLGLCIGIFIYLRLINIILIKKNKLFQINNKNISYFTGILIYSSNFIILLIPLFSLCI